jgi:hypothetical protein
MFVVIPVVKSKCGSGFEAHIAFNPGAGQSDSSAICPDCGERLYLPDRLVRPLIRLQ